VISVIGGVLSTMTDIVLAARYFLQYLCFDNK